jgi:hypothetical protein
VDYVASLERINTHIQSIGRENKFLTVHWYMWLARLKSANGRTRYLQIGNAKDSWGCYEIMDMSIPASMADLSA